MKKKYNKNGVKNNSNKAKIWFAILIVVIFIYNYNFNSESKIDNNQLNNTINSTQNSFNSNTNTDINSNTNINTEATNTETSSALSTSNNSISEIPDYSQINQQDIDINGNVPYFENELTTNDFERYSELDNLGRAQTAYINVTKDTMPAEGVKRESLTYKPTGWHQVLYGANNKEHLYERCHLIAWSLSNENNNPKNLITGTSKMNEIMIIYENQIRNWINTQYQDGNKYHVMYRVTPVYDGNNLLAKGVELEAESVEKGRGEPVKFNRFIYNVEENFKIDYVTGKAENI